MIKRNINLFERLDGQFTNLAFPIKLAMEIEKDNQLPTISEYYHNVHNQYVD